MESRQTNYQLYEKLGILLESKKPWSADYVNTIRQLEREPGYPFDDPLIIDLINFALEELKTLAPYIQKRVSDIQHILEIDFQSFDSYQYDLLSTHLYDLADHLQGSKQPHLSNDELRSTKIYSLARLLESLAAISANNAQLLNG